jgi:DNA-directed RNA polymerase subunit RPC12/RpoP
MVLDVPQPTGTAAGSEEPPLGQDARPPPAGQATYISVICPICRTRMYGTIEQVGQTLTCPDCGTAAVVPPPPAVAKATAVPAPVDVYPLAGEREPAAGAARPSQQGYVAVICHRCQTRLTATLDQVGDTLLCPDCGMANVVPAPPQRPKRKPADEAQALYGLAKVPQEETSPSPVPAEEPAVRDWRLAPTSEKPVLPRWPFITGTFSFPFFPGNLARIVVLTVWSLAADALVTESIELGGVSDPRATFLSAIFGAVTLMVTIGWFVFASACALAVVRETANGCDRIVEWPGLAFIDWFLEPLYLFDALCVSVLPSAGLMGYLALSGRPAQAAPLVSTFFFFPLVLLSMLEKSSPLAAISWPVFRSLGTAWRGWAGFYLAAVALLAAAGNVVLAVRRAGEFWGIIVSSPVIVIVWFIYFRLLGRLAWYCGEHGGVEAEADAEENADQEHAAETE